jgi:hypothetical protein
MSDSESIFSKLIDEPKREQLPKPELRWMDKDAARPARKLSPEQRLLNWIQHDWPEATLCARDIYRYSPRPIRDHKSAMTLAKILTERGWLTPTESHRCDRFVWRIMRSPVRE